ncbi:MAG: GNAT family N-acetyltransferase [Deltaproteobacteria bacterium]|nr:GNAT family N-acetyltransferase [Deltaproteobacteria bacterium]
MTLVCTEWADRAAWNAFVWASPQGSVFCHTDFLDALGCPYRLYRVTKGDAVVAAVPVLLDADGVRPQCAPHPFTLYQGPMFAASVAAMPIHSRYPMQSTILEFLIESLVQQLGRVSFCLHHSLVDIRQFVWYRYHQPASERFAVHVRHTGLIDLRAYRDFEAYLESVRPVRRREYRKAVASGLAVQVGTVADVGMFTELFVKTFGRQEITLPAEELRWFQRIAAMALQTGMGELLFCVQSDGQPICGTLFLYDPRCSYYLLSGTDTEFRKSAANTMLLFENVQRAQQRGLSWVDCIGVNSPWRGDFKIGFNAAPTPYYVVTWPPSA